MLLNCRRCQLVIDIEKRQKDSFNGVGGIARRRTLYRSIKKITVVSQFLRREEYPGNIQHVQSYNFDSFCNYTCIRVHINTFRTHYTHACTDRTHKTEVTETLHYFKSCKLDLVRSWKKNWKTVVVLTAHRRGKRGSYVLFITLFYLSTATGGRSERSLRRRRWRQPDVGKQEEEIGTRPISFTLDDHTIVQLDVGRWGRDGGGSVRGWSPVSHSSCQTMVRRPFMKTCICLVCGLPITRCRLQSIKTSNASLKKDHSKKVHVEVCKGLDNDHWTRLCRQQNEPTLCLYVSM